MGTAIDRILQLWKETFEEEGWHVPVLAALDGLTAPQAAWKPSPERHSVWQIADHLAFWKEYLLRRLRGAPRRPTGWAKGLDWRAIPEVTEAAWTAAVQRLVDAQAALKAELGLRTDEDLEKPLPDSPFPLYSIQTMVIHDAYHCGQICYIRALQGIPAKGSWDE